MKPTIEEERACFIEMGLLHLLGDTVCLHEYIEDQLLLHPNTSKNDTEKFKELLQKFQESNENWYNLENFEDNEKLLDRLVSIKMKSIYYILEIKMWKLKMASEKVDSSRKVNSVLKNLEVDCYCQANTFCHLLINSSPSFRGNFDKIIGEENKVQEFMSDLSEFFDKNQEKIAATASNIPARIPVYIKG